MSNQKHSVGNDKHFQKYLHHRFKPGLQHHRKMWTRIVWYGIVLFAIGLGMAVGILYCHQWVILPKDSGNDSKAHVTNKWLNLDDVKGDIIKELNPENIRENLKILTQKPHLAGSVQDEEHLVGLIKERFASYLDAVEVFPYNVLLSFPNDTDKNYVAIVYPNGTETRQSNPVETPVTTDEQNATVVSAFNAYAPAGHVEGNMFYVNYGREKDYQEFTRHGLNISGSICIARYGQTYRGDKEKFGAMHGCKALVLYTDPFDYGGAKAHSWNPRMADEDAYPHTWWMPSTGFQRGDVGGSGDPLTPDYPSLNFTYRIPLKEAGLPEIPTFPISYKDAYQYLSILSGPIAPNDWQGGLNVTYRFGGSFVGSHANSKALVHVANYMERKTIHTVIGYIRGWLEPDRYVIMGNHRDAWTFGGADPNSGTAVVLEVSRAIAKVVKDGKWRPRRTIIFCNWGAEEFGEIGSMEWVEQMEKRLLMNAVSYLNIDIAVDGNKTFRVQAYPSLQQLIFNATKFVKNPNYNESTHGRTTVYDTWLHYLPDPLNPDRPIVQILGSGSDFINFMQRTGVASLDIRYTYDPKTNTSSYPVYHSLHDTFHYFENFLDPGFNLSLAIASISAYTLVELSGSYVLPLNPVDTGNKLVSMANALKNNYKDIFNEEKVSLDDLFRIIGIFRNAAEKLMEHAAKLNPSTNEIHLRMINDKLFYINRGFLDYVSLPNQHLFHNVVFAPSTHDSYSGSGFPAVNDAAAEAQRKGSLDYVRKELSILCVKILSAAQLMHDF